MTRDLPDLLRNFAAETCGIAANQFRMLPGEQMPEPAKSLLVHERDMTSTLASAHGSELRVDVLQHFTRDSFYLREVFLRTTPTDRVVEYGVIAIALDQFSPPQQAAIQAGQMPLGAVLHHFQIPFASRPIGFFSLAAASLSAARQPALAGGTCYGRFNRLTKPTGEPLAWIMEILPP